MLELEGIDYVYGRGKRALSGVSAAFDAGIVGLLGPNGAGKSTLMRLLATITRPSAGRILWTGIDIALDPNALRRALGYLPQDFGVYAALSAREFLCYLAAAKGLAKRVADERVDNCLAEVGLANVADQRLATFSGGMRQRVGIAQALLTEPRLLVIDEPTVGLDPEERMRFRHLLSDLAGERLVILSTHIVSDIEASATQLAVLVDGELRFAGDPGALIERVQGMVWECEVAAEAAATLRQRQLMTASSRVGSALRVRIVAERAPSDDAVGVAPTLEDAYAWQTRQFAKAA